MLAIGTFGNKDEITKQEDDPSSSSEEIPDFTPEEIGKLQKELTKLLRRKPNVEKEISELPLDRFLNCPSSLEVDRRISNALCSELSDDHKDEDIEKTLSVILDKCKDICAEKSKKSIGKKSISFLMKKMFVCRSGFDPTPSLRDSLQESRMEKVNICFDIKTSATKISHIHVISVLISVNVGLILNRSYFNIDIDSKRKFKLSDLD